MSLDLVEISPKTEPPVCKIIDYKKFIYDQKKKQKAIKSKAVKVVVKELRFGPNTGEHDFDFKLKHAIKFLQDGAKVKAFVFFRGRTIIFKDKGEILHVARRSVKDERHRNDEINRNGDIFFMPAYEYNSYIIWVYFVYF